MLQLHVFVLICMRCMFDIGSLVPQAQMEKEASSRLIGDQNSIEELLTCYRVIQMRTIRSMATKIETTAKQNLEGLCSSLNYHNFNSIKRQLNEDLVNLMALEEEVLNNNPEGSDKKEIQARMTDIVESGLAPLQQ